LKKKKIGKDKFLSFDHLPWWAILKRPFGTSAPMLDARSDGVTSTNKKLRP